MKFLLDVGISPRLGKLLEADGHACRYVPHFYSNTIPDIEILRIARHSGEVIITHDLDFEKMLAFSAKNTPSVILFRIHHISSLAFYAKLNNLWDTISSSLEQGAFVVIEEHSVRIRALPIVG